MSEWWTYRLSDLILFSPDVYYRSFALYHHRIWPAHLVLLVIAVVAIGCRRASDAVTRGRIVAALLAACWVWIAVAFHLQSYATINWAAKYFAAAFLIQSVLLVVLGIRGSLRFDPQRTGLIVVLLGLLAVAAPIAGMLTGRQWDQVELPGLTPDPTAAATIALLQISGSRPHRLALVIPVLWCVVGGLTLYALHSLEAGWTWLSLLLALLCPVFVGRVRNT